MMFRREFNSMQRKVKYVFYSFSAGFVAGLIAAGMLGIIPGGQP